MARDGFFESAASVGAAYLGAFAPALPEPAFQGCGVGPWRGKPTSEVPRRCRREIALDGFEHDGWRYREDVLLTSGWRRGPATAILSKATLMDEDDVRGDISSVYPPGWHQRRVSWIVDKQGWLYNRSHLVAWCLCGVDLPENLVTGTRYLNKRGMLPIETEVYRYIQKTGAYVAYRVTPLYRAGEKVARGVRIEARSLGRRGLSIDRVCYNVQPGYEIDYRTGKAKLVV